MTQDTTSLPDIHVIAEDLLGLPYEHWDCWAVLRHCFKRGWDMAIPENPALALHYVTEIWWQEDDEDPLSLVEPWDVVIYRTRGMASSHVGIVLDQHSFLHTQRRLGVCLEPLARWKTRLLQLARLRQRCVA